MLIRIRVSGDFGRKLLELQAHRRKTGQTGKHRKQAQVRQKTMQQKSHTELKTDV